MVSNLFGYDFVIDIGLRVWLCEINASPAVADALLPGLVRALIRRAIDPVFAAAGAASAAGGADSEGAPEGSAAEDFELVYRSRGAQSTAG